MCSSVRVPSRRPRSISSERPGLGERLLEAEPLAPVLQHVGEVALGQAQPLVQRDPLDLLALPGAVDDPRDGQLAEDRDVAAVMPLGQPPDGPALGRSRPPARGRRRPGGRRRPTAGCARGRAVAGSRSRSTVSIRWPSWAACCTKSRRASNCCWALRAACSGVMIMARSPGCSHIGCVETDVLPQGGLAFHSLPPQLLVSKRSPGERAASYAQIIVAVPS